uniref:Uncharacterized protein n=1 Tax=Arundo donax TaxID=35708 RepID=A0A0A9ADP5_ARUDO
MTVEKHVNYNCSFKSSKCSCIDKIIKPCLTGEPNIIYLNKCFIQI